MITLFCVECAELVRPTITDESFAHEFGCEPAWTCICPECGADLPLPDYEPEPEPPEDYYDRTA